MKLNDRIKRRILNNFLTDLSVLLLLLLLFKLFFCTHSGFFLSRTHHTDKYKKIFKKMIMIYRKKKTTTSLLNYQIWNECFFFFFWVTLHTNRNDFFFGTWSVVLGAIFFLASFIHFYLLIEREREIAPKSKWERESLHCCYSAKMFICA